MTHRSRLRRRFGPPVVGAALALLVGACGGDDTPEGADTGATTAATSTTTSAETTTTTPPPDPAPIVIAHRGASGYAPEHTFAAYDLALEQGADYLEQDLQITADGELVVLHDDTLDRTTRGPADACSGPVSARTLDQVRRCDAGAWFNESRPDRADPAFVGLTVPTLREVLDRYGTDVRYYIEIKSPEDAPGMEQALLDVLDDAGVDAAGGAGRPPVYVQSFSADSLRTVHALRPDIPLVQLVSVAGPTIDDTFLDATAEYAVGIGPSSARVDAAVVASSRERCLVVHPYTVDDPVEMTRLLDLGVDGMFTNTPDVLVERLDGRAAPANRDGCPD